VKFVNLLVESFDDPELRAPHADMEGLPEFVDVIHEVA
jgi:hypothetical protein